ncbi:hypothetical protein IWW36_003440 [Coemansia brasiliensis]|uniref:Grh/CP2 DB domain-containing protein n=1 Tax=Coemansia brasiliensis TaxID=2650707 RepID=A0A9W8I5F1_9FUNG|nr:hypothetical protein IWW36_003440 [Coemansia brasiliensis]
MSSIPTDTASYYSAYNIGNTVRRDGAESMIDTSAAQSLSAHEFFNHQAQQQQQHRNSQLPPLHQQLPSSSAAPMSQYHAPQPQPPHVTIPQYHAHNSHVSSVSTHHASAAAVAAVSEAANAYQPGAFAQYPHSAYHTNQLAHPVGFGSNTNPAVDSASSMATDNEYSVMAVAGAFHAHPASVHIQPHHSHSQASGSSGMQFRCVLEAPTAAAQKSDESSLTYLNKGQLYGISIVDTSNSDSFYSTTLRIAFHEDSHRKGASTYWNFWLNQQENPRAARAVELDKAGSIGVISAENRRFDRVTFQWQGQRGAKVMIRFNCLSTDFSRIKGVKGIPLRIHIDTHEALSSDSSSFAASIGQVSSPITAIPTTSSVSISTNSLNSSSRTLSSSTAIASASMSTPVSPVSANGPNAFEQNASNSTANLVSAAAGNSITATTNSPVQSSGLVSGKIIERCYARIKLFRDKGAERKNKDDLRHLDKMWEKQKAKLALNGSSTAAQQQQLNEFRNAFAPVQEATLFCEYTLTGDECDNEEPVIVDDSWPAGAASIQTVGPFESPGSSLATPVAGLSSMNIGMPGVNLSALNTPLGTATMAFMRKRSADETDVLAPNKRQFSPSSLSSAGLTSTLGPNNVELVGVDPTYVPMPRKRKAVLVIYVRFQGENIYRAIYLEQLTVEDMVAKLAQRLEMQTNAADVEVVRRTKKGLTVKVDDSVVAQLEDEQDMEVECSFAADTGALTIYLNY